MKWMRTLSALIVAACVTPAAVHYAFAAAEPEAKPGAVASSPRDVPVAHGSANRCRTLANWSSGDVSILTTEPVAGGTEVALPLAGLKVAAPAHCLVRGEIARRVGTDGKPYAIGFELRLPDDWNGRFLYQGGGGYDGFLAPALGGMTGGRRTALERGFAVVSTDAGHRDPGRPGTQGDYGADPQARRDFAYNALDRVTTTAKVLVGRYYAAPIRHSYFAGCSGGGRQAMLAPLVSSLSPWVALCPTLFSEITASVCRAIINSSFVGIA